MTAVEATFDAAKALGASRAVAMRHTPAPYRHWMDDLAAEVALLAFEHAQAGYYTTRTWYRRFLVHAMRRFFGVEGTRRNREAMALELDEALLLVEDARVDDRALSMVRLQRVWPTLTERQQRALTMHLAGYSGPEIAGPGGRGKGATAIRRSAVKRLRDPSGYRRDALEVRRGSYRCGACGAAGHDRRVCPMRGRP